MDCFFLAVLGSNVFNSSTYFQASRRKTCITSTAHQIKVAFLLTDELSLQRLERRGSSFRQIFKVATQFKQQLHKHFTPLHMHRNWEREQVPYETKKNFQGGVRNVTLQTTFKMAAVEDRTNSNPLVQPLLTDLYQITMAYAYWKSGKIWDNAVFDLYFRRNPFHGEFTVFAGLEECVHFVRNFHFTDSGRFSQIVAARR